MERFRHIPAGYYRNAHGILICFDITDRKMFESVSSTWLGDTEKHCSDNTPRVLVGMKLDLEFDRKVSTEEA